MFFSQVRIRPNFQHSPQLNHLIKGNTYGIHQLLWDLFPQQKERSFIYREEIAREQLGVKSGVKGESIFYLVSKEQPAGDNQLMTIKRKIYSPKLQAGDRLAFKLRANPVIARKLKGKKNSVRHDVVMDSQRSLLLELSSILGLSGLGKKSVLKKEIVQAIRKSGNQQVIDRLQAVINENERFRGSHSKKLSLYELLNSALKSNVDKTLEGWFVNKGEKNGFELVRDEKMNYLKFQAESYRWHSLTKKGKSAGFSSVDFDGVLKVTEPDSFMKTLFNGIGPAKSFGCGLMLVRHFTGG